VKENSPSFFASPFPVLVKMLQGAFFRLYR
jgi:hypothetical protein